MSWSEKLSIKLAERLIPADADAYNIGQVSHGIELLLLRFLNTAVLIALSTFFGCLLEAILIAVIYLFIRNFTGGVHFKSAPACIIIGNLLMVVSAKAATILSSQSQLAVSLMVILATIVSGAVNFRYAPAKHTYVKYEESTKKRNRLIVLILLFCGCLLIEFFVYFNYKQLGTIYSFAVLLQSFLLHPWAFQVMERIEILFSRKGVSKC